MCRCRDAGGVLACVMRARLRAEECRFAERSDVSSGRRASRSESGLLVSSRAASSAEMEVDDDGSRSGGRMCRRSRRASGCWLGWEACRREEVV